MSPVRVRFLYRHMSRKRLPTGWVLSWFANELLQSTGHGCPLQPSPQSVSSNAVGLAHSFIFLPVVLNVSGPSQMSSVDWNNVISEAEIFMQCVSMIAVKLWFVISFPKRLQESLYVRNKLCREHWAKIRCFDRVDWYTYTFNSLWLSYLKSLQHITVCLSANAHWDLKPPFWLLSFLRVTLADSFYCTTESCGDFFFSLSSFTWIYVVLTYLSGSSAAIPLQLRHL